MSNLIALPLSHWKYSYYTLHTRDVCSNKKKNQFPTLMKENSTIDSSAILRFHYIQLISLQSI